MADSNLHSDLLLWYKKNARDLPWRQTRNPYKIWLSEIILQQTRVNQGLPYYLNFLKNFPTIESLALAEESEVLRQWQGLGYYSRARNIHKCAKIVYNDLHGKFPESFEDLCKLPGIGPYTAAAISSFAFKQPSAAIDGNALRVFTRFWGISQDIGKMSTITDIRKKVNEIIPENHPDIFNQAIMELGATVCQPANPDCNHCPLARSCYALEKGILNKLPVKNNKTKVRKRYFNYFIIKKGEKIAMFERTSMDIWKGLFDFYLIETDRLIEPMEISDPFISESLSKGSQIDIITDNIRHVLSHQVISARFFEMSLQENLLEEESTKNVKLNFYSEKETLDLPKPVLVNNFLKLYFDNREVANLNKDYNL